MFQIELEVRDSEIDAQGVVNNANYFVYMQHARHKFIESLGMNFAQMTAQKQNLFLISSSIEFKKSLTSGEKFTVTCKVVPSGRKLRFAIEQEVINSNKDICAKAINTIVCVDGNNRNRPYIPDGLK